jgi:hypothetical protein
MKTYVPVRNGKPITTEMRDFEPSKSIILFYENDLVYQVVNTDPIQHTFFIFEHIFVFCLQYMERRTDEIPFAVIRFLMHSKFFSINVDDMFFIFWYQTLRWNALSFLKHMFSNRIIFRFPKLRELCYAIQYKNDDSFMSDETLWLVCTHVDPSVPHVPYCVYNEYSQTIILLASCYGRDDIVVRLFDIDVFTNQSTFQYLKSWFTLIVRDGSARVVDIILRKFESDTNKYPEFLFDDNLLRVALVCDTSNREDVCIVLMNHKESFETIERFGGPNEIDALVALAKRNQYNELVPLLQDAALRKLKRLRDK